MKQRCRAFATVDELVQNGEFDGATVCLPNDEGPPAIEALAQAGKHVLAEKPLAAAASAALAAVRFAGVAFQARSRWPTSQSETSTLSIPLTAARSFVSKSTTPRGRPLTVSGVAGPW